MATSACINTKAFLTNKAFLVGSRDVSEFTLILYIIISEEDKEGAQRVIEVIYILKVG